MRLPYKQLEEKSEVVCLQPLRYLFSGQYLAYRCGYWIYSYPASEAPNEWMFSVFKDAIRKEMEAYFSRVVDDQCYECVARIRDFYERIKT